MFAPYDPMKKHAVLELSGFGAAFGDRTVLNSVTFSIASPGCTVLLGPSGTGKSTLVRTLAGFNQSNPSLQIWGKALYEGQACDSENRPNLVMQHSKLLVSDVLENLVCNLPDRAKLTQRMQIERVAQLLEETGCPQLLNCLLQKVVERSVSEQRVISILRHAFSNAGLLMIDEPTTGLRAEQAEPILQLIEYLAGRRAVMVVLHNLLEARRLAHHVVLLANGVAEEVRNSPDFFENPNSASARRFLTTGSCPEISHELRTSSSMPRSGVELTTLPILPARPAVVISENCGPRGFLWLLPGQLAGTPWPGVFQDVRYDLDALRAVGVTRLISLTEELFDASLAAEFGMECMNSPMADMHPPTLDQGIDLCVSIDNFLMDGEVVAVHCRAGLGRTGTVLAAYWLWRAGGSMNALKALEDVRRIEPLWVQSQAQVNFLQEFAPVVANRFLYRKTSHDPGHFDARP